MDQYLRIAGLDNDVEASLLDAILTDRGVPHALISFHDSAFDGIFQMQDGWGVVEGPGVAREEILEILKGLRGQTTAADEQA